MLLRHHAIEARLFCQHALGDDLGDYCRRPEVMRVDP
jgi:hypothetical protein